MAYKKGAVSFHAEVDKDVSDTLKKQLKRRGQVKNDATTAALRIWTALPAELQVAVINESPEDFLKFLTARLIDSRILEVLRNVSPTDLLDAIEKAAK